MLTRLQVTTTSRDCEASGPEFNQVVEIVGSQHACSPEKWRSVRCEAAHASGGIHVELQRFRRLGADAQVRFVNCRSRRLRVAPVSAWGGSVYLNCPYPPPLTELRVDVSGGCAPAGIALEPGEAQSVRVDVSHWVPNARKGCSRRSAWLDVAGPVYDEQCNLVGWGVLRDKMQLAGAESRGTTPVTGVTAGSVSPHLGRPPVR